MQMLRRFWNEDDGQDMIEYALIAGLISVVAYAAISSTGASINGLWTTVNSNVTAAS
jgi:pilus assembly protein Flp/PilA